MRAPGSTWCLAACPSLPRPTQHSAWGHRTHRAHGDTPPWRSQQGPSCRPQHQRGLYAGGAVLPTRSLWKTLLSTHTRAHSHTHTQVHTCIHARIHSFTHMCKVQRCAWTNAHTCAHMHTRASTHIHMHVRAHSHTHTHRHIHTHSSPDQTGAVRADPSQ